MKKEISYSRDAQPGFGPRTCYIRPSQQIKKYKKLLCAWWRFYEWI